MCKVKIICKIIHCWASKIKLFSGQELRRHFSVHSLVCVITIQWNNEQKTVQIHTLDVGFNKKNVYR